MTAEERVEEQLCDKFGAEIRKSRRTDRSKRFVPESANEFLLPLRLAQEAVRQMLWARQQVIDAAEAEGSFMFVPTMTMAPGDWTP